MKSLPACKLVLSRKSVIPIAVSKNCFTGGVGINHRSCANKGWLFRDKKWQSRL